MYKIVILGVVALVARVAAFESVNGVFEVCADSQNSFAKLSSASGMVHAAFSNHMSLCAHGDSCRAAADDA